MKRTLLSLSLMLFIGLICHAQTDSTKKTTDTLTVKKMIVVQKDTVPAKLVSDTANYALLYVYRQKSFSGSMISYDLRLTNALFPENVLGSVKNNSKFVVKLYQVGKSEIWARTESKRSVFIDVKFGQKYYLKCGISMGIMVGRPDLNLIYPEQGVLDYENVKGKAK